MPFGKEFWKKFVNAMPMKLETELAIGAPFAIDVKPLGYGKSSRVDLEKKDLPIKASLFLLFERGASGLLAPNFHYTIPAAILSRDFAKKNKKIFFLKVLTAGRASAIINSVRKGHKDAPTQADNSPFEGVGVGPTKKSRKNKKTLDKPTTT